MTGFLGWRPALTRIPEQIMGVDFYINRSENMRY